MDLLLESVDGLVLALRAAVVLGECWIGGKKVMGVLLGDCPYTNEQSAVLVQLFPGLGREPAPDDPTDLFGNKHNALGVVGRDRPVHVALIEHSLPNLPSASARRRIFLLFEETCERRPSKEEHDRRLTPLA